MLKYHYADPLRKLARSKDTFIIPAYEANTLDNFYLKTRYFLPISKEWLLSTVTK